MRGKTAMLKFIINRLREPSTWAALPSIAVAIGLGAPSGTWEAVTQVGLGLAGLAGVLLREKGVE